VLVDRVSEDWGALWWVRLDGHARVVTDPDERAGALAALVAKFQQYVDRAPGRSGARPGHHRLGRLVGGLLGRVEQSGTQGGGQRGGQRQPWDQGGLHRVVGVRLAVPHPGAGSVGRVELVVPRPRPVVEEHRFETPYQLPQLALWDPQPDEWLTVVRVAPAAPRRPRPLLDIHQLRLFADELADVATS